MKRFLMTFAVMALIADCAQPAPPPPAVRVAKPPSAPAAADPSGFVVSPTPRVEPKPEAGK